MKRLKNQKINLYPEWEVLSFFRYLDMSYFIAGNFQKASGKSENIFHLAPILNYKF